MHEWICCQHISRSPIVLSNQKRKDFESIDSLKTNNTQTDAKHINKLKSANSKNVYPLKRSRTHTIHMNHAKTVYRYRKHAFKI